MTKKQEVSPKTEMDKAESLMRNGRFGDATTVLNELLSTDPSHVEGLYCLAVCQRKENKIPAAQATLTDLLAIMPNHARAYQERGYLFQTSDKTADAISAFEKAVALNPTLHASWRVLAKAPAYKKAQEAERRVAWLTSLPPELLSVASLIHQDELYRAEQICRAFLKRRPHHLEAMRLLAELAVKFQVLDEAEFLLKSCVEFAPDFLHARLNYVSVLHRRQKFHDALKQAQILHNTDPNNPAFETSLANAQLGAGEFETAIETYQSALAKSYETHSIHLTLGHALKTIGRTDDAVAAYRAAYGAMPTYGDAFWSLANLKTYHFPDNELNHMRDMESATSTSEDDRIHLCFAIGKALEDRQDFEVSFEYYKKGNSLKRQKNGYKREYIHAELDYLKEHFDTDFFHRKSGSDFSSSAPIFIVGLPRAGSTLLEQILASHSQVDGTMELANILGMAHRLSGRGSGQKTARYPSRLGDLSPDDLLRLGKSYIEDTQYHRQGAPRFIDKMPNNFRHIQLIRLILPNAKIIDARRHPMACCFSGFKQLFAEGQEFTYDLNDIGDYYRNYVEIMDHWDRELPGYVLRVQHEDVISDLETQVRRVLEYCELPFEQACIDFHETKRAVRTPSSEQVRQPIYRSGMELWKNYAPFLDPLKRALGPLFDESTESGEQAF